MNFRGVRAFLLFLGFGLACLLIGLLLRANYAPEWMAADTTQKPPGIRPWAVEADCYSQLARVQRILEGKGLLQNHFTVENWPEGLNPSTTAPFDYAILLLYFPLWPFTKHPLDWAGALVSPALWVALVAFWTFIRSREFNLFGRALLIAGAATLPDIIWATTFGRPRHQSLIVVLVAMGLTAEYERWRLELTPKRAWNLFAGIVWGLACWTSLFEPVVILGSLILFNLVARRRENSAFLGALAAVLILMTILEGHHIYLNFYQITHLTPAYRQYAWNWLHTIGEIRPVSGMGMLWHFTCILLVLPLLAWRVWPRADGNRTDAFLVLLTALLIVLTMTQLRWGYYGALSVLMLVVRFCQVTPTRWTRLTALVIFFGGTLYANSSIFSTSASALPIQPSLQMAKISAAIDAPGGIMAPWWLSPGLLYFSGQPIVSGSSHCGISGIVASANFYAASSWADAQRILDERKVRWIVVWDDPGLDYQVVDKSRLLLGEPAIADDAEGSATIEQLLFNDRLLPTWVHLRAVTQQMKLYEYTPDSR